MNYLKPISSPLRRIFYITLVVSVIFLSLVSYLVQAEEPGSLKWKYETGEQIKCSPAVSEDGTVYIGSQNGNLFALKPDGSLKWKYETGGSITASPAIAGDGTVLIGAYNESETTYIYALNPDGTLKWKYKTEGVLYSPPAYYGVYSSLAIAEDGTIYAGKRGGVIYALNPDGRLKWKYNAPDAILSYPSISEDGTIYVGSHSGYLYALRPDGSLKWKYETGGSIDDSSPTIAENGTIYVGSAEPGEETAGQIYAITPEGNLKWKHDTEKAVYFSPSLGRDGTVYFGSWNHHIYALNPDGSLKWKHKTGDAVFSSPAVADDGTIYIGSWDNNLYALNPDGTLKWKYETGDLIFSSPAVADDGTIYVGSEDSSLYAFKGESSGLATSAWPMSGQNPRHTSRAVTTQNATGSFRGEKYAIIVGINDYKNFPSAENANCAATTCDLQLAEEDALDFKEILTGNIRSLPEKNIFLLTGKEATKNRIFSTMQKVNQLADREDLVVFYFSGHGTRGEKSELKDEEDGRNEYLLSYETELDTLADTAIVDDEISRWAWDLDADSLAIIDAVSSGGVEVPVLLAASKEGQYAYTSAKLKNSYLTFYLVNALKGEADYDGNSKLTLQEIYDYIKRNLEKSTPVLKGPMESIPEFVLKGAPSQVKPEASFHYSPKEPKAKQEVNFVSDASDPDGTITDYNWVFGDGAATSAKDPTHKYSQPGTYKVELTVTGDEGATDSVTKKITVSESKAELTVKVADVSGGNLDAEVYSDGKLEGDTGRDGRRVITGISSGSYEIESRKEGYSPAEVEVTLSPGEKDKITLTLEEKNKPPKAKGILIEPPLPEAGEKIIFAGTESTDPDGSIESCTWDFGEGTNKRGKEVSHVYPQAGSYKVNLTVADDDGATSSIAKKVTVLPNQRKPLRVKDKYALVIGISEYEDESLNLEYSAKDATAFKRLLLDSDVGGFKKEKITTLRNEAATKKGIESALDNLVERAGQNDLVVIYYSGQGTRCKDFNGDETDSFDECYITYDSDLTDDKTLYNTAYRDDHMGKKLKSMRTQGQTVLVFLDTRAPGSSISANSIQKSDFKSGNIILMSAVGGKDQHVYESPSLKHGVFTYYLLKALEGKADTDADGRISLREIYNFVRPRQKEFIEDNFSNHANPAIKGIMTDRKVTFPPVEKNNPPTSSFTHSPKAPKVGKTVTFDSDSTDTDGTIAKYRWTFGDGASSSVKDPTHSYSEPGSYDVKLTVVDDRGEKDSATRKITVVNRKPTSSFTYTPKEPTLGQKIKFNAGQSSDPDEKIKEYIWDLTGNGIADKSGPEITHAYESEGTYTVTLTVIDTHGAKSSSTRQISLKEKDSETTQPEEQAEIDQRHALVVGVAKYKNFSLRDLRYPAKDARSFKKFLLDAGFKEDNIITLLNKEATSDNFDEALRKLVSRSDKDDQVIIYYSGHGASGPDKNGDEKNYSESDTHDEYFATYDTNSNDLYLTAYSDDQFSNQINSLDAKEVLIFLDSCFAGGATKGVKGTNKGVSVDNVFSDLGFGGSKVTLFAASRQTQDSYESQKLGHGVFTYYLLEGLKGKADRNSDGTISGKELENYLPSRVSEFVEENNLPEKKRGTPQQPLVKGNVNKNLVRYPKEYTTRIVSVQGKKKKAKNDDYVLINKGSKDGVTPGDVFEVHLTEQSKEGTVVFDKFTARIEVTSVSGPHLSICRVKKADFYLREDFVVEKKKK